MKVYLNLAVANTEKDVALYRRYLAHQRSPSNWRPITFEEWKEKECSEKN